MQILYVEDDVDIQEALQEVLEAAGYRVTVASTATQGLSFMRSQKFHLVISDYNLPDILECRYPESTSPEDLLVELRRSLEEYRPTLIVLDSISSIAHSTSTRGFRQFMVGFASLVREHSRSALLTQAISEIKEDERTAPFLSTIADAIISLDYQRHGKKLERTISVTKMRGSAHSDDAFRLLMRPGGLGIEALEEPGA
ncbi:ATPase domain-containing protein [Hyalangium sp.]|uniref:ATPase domain-containing protein n=1 Tax=Hyalangium sp. TaxID=2028555 RepID=UPI002D51D7B3|nr:ATPase domain-containing protein [Hyalangium sp.]HYI01524.1 ATPase domain-containing protein [Hyalangium sp.]